MCSTSVPGFPGPASWEGDLREVQCLERRNQNKVCCRESLSSAPDRLRIGQESQEQFCKSQGIWTELGDRPGHSPLDSDSLCWLGWASLPVQVHTQLYRRVHSHTNMHTQIPFPTLRPSTQASCTCLLMLTYGQTPVHTDSINPGSKPEARSMGHTALEEIKVRPAWHGLRFWLSASMVGTHEWWTYHSRQL